MKNNQLDSTKGVSPIEKYFDFSYYLILEMRRTITHYKVCCD